MRLELDVGKSFTTKKIVLKDVWTRNIVLRSLQFFIDNFVLTVKKVVIFATEMATFYTHKLETSEGRPEEIDAPF